MTHWQRAYFAFWVAFFIFCVLSVFFEGAWHRWRRERYRREQYRLLREYYRYHDPRSSLNYFNNIHRR